MLGRIMNGLTTVGIYGAIVLGLLFFIETIFSADSSWFLRIVFGLVAAFAFLVGYFANEKEAEKSGEDNAE